MSNENEGGPFGTPMRSLVEFLKRFKDHEALYPTDKAKIENILVEF